MIMNWIRHYIIARQPHGTAPTTQWSALQADRLMLRVQALQLCPRSEPLLEDSAAALEVEDGRATKGSV
jgi:hypothetical protein